MVLAFKAERYQPELAMFTWSNVSSPRWNGKIINESNELGLNRIERPEECSWSSIQRKLLQNYPNVWIIATFPVLINAITFTDTVFLSLVSRIDFRFPEVNLWLDKLRSSSISCIVCFSYQLWSRWNASWPFCIVSASIRKRYQPPHPVTFEYLRWISFFPLFFISLTTKTNAQHNVSIQQTKLDILFA